METEKERKIRETNTNFLYLLVSERKRYNNHSTIYYTIKMQRHNHFPEIFLFSYSLCKLIHRAREQKEPAFSTSSLFFEIRSDNSRIRQRDKIIPCDNDMI